MAELARLETFRQSNVALRLDAPPNDAVTFLHGSSGGSIWADVISQISAGEDFARKQLGAPHYDPFTVQVGLTIPPLLFDWIAESWKSHPPRHDGALLLCNPNLSVQEARGFQSALLAETGFPALDASSKEIVYVTLRLAPTSILPDKKEVQSAGPVVLGPKQKVWLAANFRLQIGELECTHVSRIEPFSINRKIDVVAGPGGGPELIPGPVDFPNLRVTMSAAHAESWLAWHEDFVLKGHNTADFEKSGSISLLTPTFTELTRLELEGLGIFRITSEEMDVERVVPRVIADVYCEQMRLLPGGSP